MTNLIYAQICYGILMDDFMDKSPDYMMEKFAILTDGINSFAWLDYRNMEKAIAYCVTWRVPVPKEWSEEYDRQIEAVEELKKQGINLE